MGDPVSHAAVVIERPDANGPRVEGVETVDPGGAFGFILTRLGR